MRILVIGGTSFVGRAITEAAIADGHEVTLFNRGQTAAGEFDEIERIVGDRNGDLSELAGEREWDATIDVCAYVPRQVRSLLQTLGNRAGHYVFISTVSVYVDAVPEHFDESAQLQEPEWSDEQTMATYGASKVACELAAAELVGDRLLIIRPGFVVGPHDPTHRFTYWVERVGAERSPMIVPTLIDQPMQVVDARDLANFTLENAKNRTTATVHVIGPREQVTFAETLDLIAEAVGTTVPELRHVDDGRLPLVIDNRDDWNFLTADHGLSRKLGMSWRPLTETIRDTAEWVARAREAGTYKPREGVGLTADEEARLLTQ